MATLGPTKQVDIPANRNAVKYTRCENWRRFLWTLLQPLFRLSPRPCFAWRRWLLRRMGAVVGRDVHIYPSATIYYPWMLRIGDYSAIGEHALIYNLAVVTIGKRVTISHRAHLCAGTHDHRDPTMPLLRLPITLDDDAWICSDAFVGPGIHVAQGAVVGARAVVVKDVQRWTVVAGNPAVKIKDRELKNPPRS